MTKYKDGTVEARLDYIIRELSILLDLQDTIMWMSSPPEDTLIKEIRKRLCQKQ